VDIQPVLNGQSAAGFHQQPERWQATIINEITAIRTAQDPGWLLAHRQIR
jgi:hypothetical protein